MASGLMDMPPGLREQGEDPIPTEGDINWGPGIEAAGEALESGRQAWIEQGERWKTDAEQRLGFSPEATALMKEISMDTSQLGGGRAGAAKLAVGLMTKPEFHGNIYRAMEKAYGKVSPELAERLRNFTEAYPARVLDKLKWWREVPVDVEKVAMPQTLGRYWDRDVRRGMNVGKWPKSSHGLEASPEEIEALKKITEGTEGAGYLTTTAKKGWFSAAQDYLDTHFHEAIHHLEKELRQTYNEGKTREAGKLLAAGKESPYFKNLMQIWDKVRDRYY